jgi:ubiquinone/menaquinone biosynthesis C-methylase UbiE
MVSAVERLVYGATQGLRVSWYFGQKMVAARRGNRIPAPPERRARMPDTARVLRDLAALFARDLDNIVKGYYAMPVDLLESPRETLEHTRLFFEDLERVNERRRNHVHSEVMETAPAGRYPRYYLQNFHYQTDGWLSEESARLYDHQVEVLFGGGADAMRRQALVPLHRELTRAGIRGARLLDVACGTGRFLREVKNNFPKLRVAALDLSPHYLAQAGRNLAAWSGTEFLEGAAEAIPAPDAGFTLATCIYLFHELPPARRREVAREISRVLAPGGLLVLVDSLQLGDEPDYDALLEHFPEGFHEPYYSSYVREDLAALFAEAGMTLEATDLAYFSKIVTFRKPAA